MFPGDVCTGDGGGIAFTRMDWALDIPVNLGYCFPPYPYASARPYRVWSPLLYITISDSIVSNNTASCGVGVCSGGGIGMAKSTIYGGVFTLSNTAVEFNTASTFGGGLYMGGPSAGSPSCTLRILNGTRIGYNTAVGAGGQVYNNCGGNFTLSNSTVMMLSSPTEVRVF